MAVLYEELDESPQEDVSPQSFRASMRVKCKWTDRYDVMNYFAFGDGHCPCFQLCVFPFPPGAQVVTPRIRQAATRRSVTAGAKQAGRCHACGGPVPCPIHRGRGHPTPAAQTTKAANL